MEREVICDYCGEPAHLAFGYEIYPQRRDLAALKFWACTPCRAYVGCHRDSNNLPLGRLANVELRTAKRLAHAAFDPLWQGKAMRRADAYAWLAGELGISAQECHIGMFDVEMCKRVREVIRNKNSSSASAK